MERLQKPLVNYLKIYKIRKRGKMRKIRGWLKGVGNYRKFLGKKKGIYSLH